MNYIQRKDNFGLETYKEAKDMLHKDGLITDNQVQNWTYPNTNSFLSTSEKDLTNRFKNRK